MLQNCSYLKGDEINVFTRNCSCSSYIAVFFHIEINPSVPVDIDQIYKSIKVLRVTEGLVEVRDVKAPSVFAAYMSN